ncbi:MAG: amino acid adenylation domain-containing protein [Desulfovibrionaceae bacterium]|nr:amino acid adenylation domain-containing protein [Desulfovibrionaceae bacterium]
MPQSEQFIAENAPLLSFLKHMGKNIGAILTGKAKARDLMFQNGSDMVESVYKDTPQSRYYNGIMARALDALLANLPYESTLNILEIGAGTGSTSASILPLLPKDRTHYVYTDISPLFTKNGKERFGDLGFVTFSTLDIERDPTSQGFAPESFDIIICANILHATRDIEESVRNTASLLKKHGFLFLREITTERPAMGFEISFGCLLGPIVDALRGNKPFLTVAGWNALLHKIGFDLCEAAPKDGPSEEHILLARKISGNVEAFYAKKEEHTNKGTGHALLGARIPSPLPTAQFVQEVSIARQPFLAEHQVFGNVVVPGTAHFDLAASAGRVFFDCEQIALSHVVLREALLLDSGPRTLEVTVEPDESERAAKVSIYSQGTEAAREGGDDWHLHVTGTVTPLAETTARRLDFPAILAKDAHEIDVQAFYETFDSYGAVHYGPIFRGLRRLWRIPGGAAAEVALDDSERGKKQGFIVHPALLDSCLQSMVAAACETEISGDGFMPFGLDEITFLGCAEDSVLCVAKLKDGDTFAQEMFSASFTIARTDGVVLAEIKNLVMRKTKKATLEALKLGQKNLGDLCYDILWRQAELPKSSDMSGHWLIIPCKNTRFIDALSKTIRDAGGSVTYCANPKEVMSLYDAKTICGILYCAALDNELPDFDGKGGLAGFKTTSCKNLLEIAKFLAEKETGENLRLGLFTCEAQKARPNDRPNPCQSILLGLEKSIANEIPKIAPISIDLDNVADWAAQVPTAASLLGAKDYPEDVVALRANSLLVPRLIRSSAIKPAKDLSLKKPEGEAYTSVFQGNGIDGISVQAMERKAPDKGSVEIEAHAYGMNFQNIMVAMGVSTNIQTLVLDCAGRVTRVGEGVTDVRVGDPVVTTVYGPFASHVHAKENLVHVLPKDFPLRDAAGIPTVFMTSWHALVEVAKLKPGERVLLHSATGGIGLSAIQIAQAIGAEIVATAGTEHKRALLRSLGIRHVYSSRNADFAARIKDELGGVHVVLNFLVHDLADASMRTLVPGGRFIEIGKTDLRTKEEVARIRPDISYHIVDLEKLAKVDEEAMRRIFSGVMDGFIKGLYHPIAKRVFSMDALQDAFHFMLEGRHIGKVIVETAFRPRSHGIRPNVTYLITGGMSDLGIALAKHLKEAGANHITLLGRRIPEASSPRSAEIASLSSDGCTVETKILDVTDRDAVISCVQAIPETAPLAGVFHLAGHLDDDTIVRLNWERFNAVLSPKVDGSYFFHEATRDLPLDHFVVFSSIASVFGTHGQANHVAANTFMDALIAERRADFLPGLSLNWGAWGQIGTVVRLGILKRIEQQGVFGFDTETGLSVLDQCMAGDIERKVVTKMQWQRMVPLLAQTRAAAFFAEIKKRADLPEKTVQSNIGAHLRTLGMEERVEELKGYLKKEIAGFLRIAIESIPNDANLTNLGMDSLISLDLFQRISRDLGIHIAPHEVAGMVNVNAMAAKFAADLGPEQERPNEKKPEKAQNAAPLAQYFVQDPEHAYDPFPLSDMQQAYWIGRHEKGLTLGGVSCHFYFEAESTGLDIDRYEAAWNSLILYEPMLRTVLSSDRREQQVLESVPHFKIPRHDLRSASNEEQEAHIVSLRERLTHEVIQVDQWPNFHIEATLYPDARVRTHISFDLILADFHGISQLFTELALIYTKGADSLPKKRVTFRDYRLAEERYRQSEQFTKDKAYWQKRAAKLPEAPKLPLAQKPHSLTNPRFERKVHILPKDVWERITKRGEARGLPPTAIALGVFAEVLALWSEDPAFTINITLFNRLPFHEDIQALIGEFTTNTLLAVDSLSAARFTDRAARIWRQLWDDMAHRSYSGVRVVRDLARERGAYLMPIVFTSTLAQHSIQGGTASSDGTQNVLGQEIYSISQTPQVWLDHQLFEVDGCLRIVFDYVADLFPEGLIDAMFTALTGLYERLGSTDESVSQDIWQAQHILDIPHEQRAVREKVNATQKSFPNYRLTDLFLENAKTHGEDTALIAKDATLSYRELCERALCLAETLRAQKIAQGSRIAVVAPKCSLQIIAVLGILLADCVYVPLDPAMPIARIREICRDANVAYVVGTGIEIPDCPFLDLAAIPTKGSDVTLKTAQKADPNDLAYIIYTSGSTGKPKGVMISHAAAMNTILAVNSTYGIGAKDRVLALAKLSFDLSVYDIFGLLAAGGTIVLPSDEECTDPTAWRTYIAEHKVTLWNTVPALAQILDAHLADTEPSAESLRAILLSGDWIPKDLPGSLQKHLPKCQVYAMGGATEASIWSNYHKTSADDASFASVPYGTPLANQGFAVLDANLRDKPDWVRGDLYITGKGLALGYWNDAEKTNQAFLEATADHPRLYKTGDCARYHPSGVLEFLGRTDNQVKVHGFRVELGEIESTLAEHPAVASAAVLLQKNVGGEPVLAAYVKTKGRDLVQSEVADREAFDLAHILTNLPKDKALDRTRFLPVWQAMEDLYTSASHALLEHLSKDGTVHPRYQKWLSRARAHAKTVQQVPNLEDALANCAEGAEELGFSAQETELLKKTVHNLPDILTEKLHSAEFYAQDAVPGFYQKIFGLSNERTAALLVHLANARDSLRILEIGAGYGTVTDFVLPKLTQKNVHYEFTDISPFFINRAKKRYAAYPNIHYRLLDIASDPLLAGFAEHSYDIIFAGNVLHDVADITKTLAYVAKLLSPSGVLVLQEETVFQTPFDLTMGLQQGFDSARDEDIRPNHPLLSREQWTKLLTGAGMSAPHFAMPKDSLEGELGLEIIVAEGPRTVERTDTRPLEDFLRTRLPSYMVPHIWTCLDAFPLTANGKIDRKRLGAQSLAGTRAVQAKTLEEQRILAIWKDILACDSDSLGVTTSFFAAGGDSLTAFQLVERINTSFGVHLRLSDLLQAQTVADQAHLVRSHKDTESTLTVPLNAAQSKETLLLYHPIEGLVTCYLPLANALSDIRLLAVQSAGLEEGEYTQDFDAMVTEGLLHMPVDCDRPLIVGGWSMGAFLAAAAAKRLKDMGADRLPVVLLDPPAKDSWDQLFDARKNDQSELLRFVAEDPAQALHAIPLSAKELAALPHKERNQALIAGLMASGQLTINASRILTVIETNLLALRAHTPSPLPCDMLFVRGAGSPESGVTYWKTICQGKCTVLEVPANHWNLTRDPESVAKIAQAIRAQMTR